MRLGLWAFCTPPYTAAAATLKVLQISPFFAVPHVEIISEETLLSLTHPLNSSSGRTWYSVVQLDFTLIIEVFNILFNRCHSESRKSPIKLHTEYFNFLCKIQFDHPVHFLFAFWRKEGGGRGRTAERGEERGFKMRHLPLVLLTPFPTFVSLFSTEKSEHVI